LLSGLQCLREPARVAPGAWRATAVALAVTLTVTLLNDYVVGSRLEAFHHTAGSMYPLISNGDRIYVRKGEVTAPSRGDVVVLMLPGGEGLFHVKRIVALPGDTVEVDGLSVVVNQTPLPQERVAERCVGMPRCTLWEESNGDARYTISADDSHVRSKPFGPITVPGDSVFVLGDNRDNSLDSRHAGPVPLTNIFGTFLMIYLPASWLGSE
jgi:signal peptidase I